MKPISLSIVVSPLGYKINNALVIGVVQVFRFLAPGGRNCG
ncbi:hypothetical protein MNB_SUP05-SYMBIONT-4-679 [hydrothermal vent metagenome]|uniref:Uncharacterized protein n=1 Tax=hydrothermal vent metagenome TaxID=652676 RepID=A0A1W1DZE3_9ZZZZ